MNNDQFLDDMNDDLFSEDLLLDNEDEHTMNEDENIMNEGENNMNDDLFSEDLLLDNEDEHTMNEDENIMNEDLFSDDLLPDNDDDHTMNSSIFNTTNLNNLPIEIIQFIMNDFDLVQLKNLRLVCKYLRDCIDYLLVKELVVYNNFNFDFFNCWSFTCQPINPKYCIQFNTKRRFFNCSLFTFKALKRLKINSPVSKCQFEFKDLNRFIQLEQLDLNLTSFKTEDEYLNLPELKMFSLHAYDPILLECNTPKLEFFKTNQNFDLIKFQPICEFLKHLELRNYHENVKCFRNLVTLKLTRTYGIDEELIISLPNLKKLHLNHSIDTDSMKDMFKFHKEIDQLVNRFHSDKRKLNRTDLEIYIFGVEFTGSKFFKDYEFNQVICLKTSLTLHLKYYCQLSDTLPFFNEFDYTELIFSLSDILNLTTFPVDFFDKFLNVQKIYAKGAIANKKLYLNLIANCPNLSVLEILFCSLDSNFYNQVLNSCSNLNKLVINEHNSPAILQFALNGFNSIVTNIELNLTNLKLLRYFETNLNLRMDFVLMCIKNLHFLKSITFNNKNDLVNIQKNYNGNFDFSFREEEIKCDKPRKINKSNLSYERLRIVCTEMERRLI